MPGAGSSDWRAVRSWYSMVAMTQPWWCRGKFVAALALVACGSSGSGGVHADGGPDGTSGAGGSQAGSGGSQAGSSGSGGSLAGSGGSQAGTAGSGGGDGGCRSGNDCGGGDFCAAYTLPPLCGGVPDTGLGEYCEDDAACADAGSDAICDATLCDFPHGGAQPQPHCRKGCSAAADCGVGHACTAEHHCEAAACTAPGDCGANFTCEPSTSKCAPTSCTGDAECADYCVNSACSATLGVCMPAVP